MGTQVQHMYYIVRKRICFRSREKGGKGVWAEAGEAGSRTGEARWLGWGWGWAGAGAGLCFHPIRSGVDSESQVAIPVVSIECIYNPCSYFPLLSNPPLLPLHLHHHHPFSLESFSLPHFPPPIPPHISPLPMQLFLFNQYCGEVHSGVVQLFHHLCFLLM